MDVAELLAGERAVTEERLAHLRDDFADVVEATRDANTDDEHDPEGHTIAFERSQTMALVQQAERHLASVDAALRRLGEGTYGICVSCGVAIAPGRLEARLTALTCISCATR